MLYVSPHADLGGAERVTLDLIALHDRSRVKPMVVFLRDGPLVRVCREEYNIPTDVIVAPALRRWFKGREVVRTLADRITSAGVDLVHSAMAWGHCYGGRAAARARRPAVWFQHTGAAWNSGIEAMASFVKAKTIIANSAFTAQGQQRVNPRRARIEIVHPGTRIPLEPLEMRRAAARAVLGIGDDEFAIGIVARLQPWKGQDVVLRAAASLLHARPKARCWIIGGALFGLDQEYADGLPRLAEALTIRDRVTFAGFRDDVPDVIAGLDVAIHASVEPEPFGLGLIEAMAHGAAIVAADAGATREIITPGVDGLLLPPGDHEALATALLALHDDPVLREGLVTEGRRTARDRFDARLMVRRIEDIYAQIMK